MFITFGLIARRTAFAGREVRSLDKLACCDAGVDH